MADKDEKELDSNATQSPDVETWPITLEVKGNEHGADAIDSMVSGGGTAISDGGRKMDEASSSGLIDKAKQIEVSSPRETKKQRKCDWECLVAKAPKRRAETDIVGTIKATVVFGKYS